MSPLSRLCLLLVERSYSAVFLSCFFITVPPGRGSQVGDRKEWVYRQLVLLKRNSYPSSGSATAKTANLLAPDWHTSTCTSTQLSSGTLMQSCYTELCVIGVPGTSFAQCPAPQNLEWAFGKIQGQGETNAKHQWGWGRPLGFRFYSEMDAPRQRVHVRGQCPQSSHRFIALHACSTGAVVPRWDYWYSHP